MKVKAERIGSAVVFSLEGRLTVEADTERLHALVLWTARHAACDIVLDFTHVRQLDCSGIGQLVALHTRVCRSGAGLMLVNVGRRLERLLDLAGLRLVFPVFGTLQEALDWCGAADAQDRLFPRPRMTAATLARPAGAFDQPADRVMLHAS